jgi:hypothetical protein
MQRLVSTCAIGMSRWLICLALPIRFSADSDVGHQVGHVLAAFKSGRYAQP